MEKRRLGQSDLYLAPIMLGGHVFGWMIDEKASFGILDAFVGRALMPSTPPTATRAGFQAAREANRRPSLATG